MSERLGEPQAIAAEVHDDKPSGGELREAARIIAGGTLPEHPTGMEQMAWDGAIAKARLVLALLPNQQRVEELEGALRDLVEVIDKAGLLNLSNGVQLGQTSWYVKASDCRERALSALNPTKG